MNFDRQEKPGAACMYEDNFKINFYSYTGFFHIGPALLAVYFLVLPSWGLWHGSSQNSPKGAPLKCSPMIAYCTRTHQIWPRISLCAICYEGNLNVDSFERGTLLAHPAGKHLVCQPTESFADKVRQDLLSGCIRLRPMWCLTILSPLRTITDYWTLLYNLVSSALWISHLYCKIQQDPARSSTI